MLKDVKVLGHRGYRAKYPENTMLSFGKALEAGAHGIECDVQKTRDGHYIIIHDDEIDRVSGQSGRIAEMTWDTLKKIDIGSGQHIPELKELLEFMPADKFINVELKEETLSTDDCPVICEMLLARLDRKSLMISSFEHNLLSYFKERQVSTGMLLGEKHIGVGIHNVARSIIRIKPDYLNLPVDIFKHIPKYLVYFLIRLLKAFGRRIAFWTINTDKQFDLIAGVSDIIITDDVTRILKRAGYQ